MRGPLLTLLVIQLLCTGSAYGKAGYQQVTVDDPYIEMHTGQKSKSQTEARCF